MIVNDRQQPPLRQFSHDGCVEGAHYRHSHWLGPFSRPFGTSRELFDQFIFVSSASSILGLLTSDTVVV